MPEEDKNLEQPEVDQSPITDLPAEPAVETDNLGRQQDTETPAMEQPENEPDLVSMAEEGVETAAGDPERPVDATASEEGAEAVVEDDDQVVVVDPDELSEQSQDRLEYVAETVFVLSEKLSDLTTALSFVTSEIQKVSDETGQTVEWSKGTRLVRPFSNLFLLLSVLLLLIIVSATGYLAVRQLQLQARQDQTSELVIQAVDNLHKREVAMDKQFASLIGTEIRQERETISKEAVQSKLNRIRGGSSELRLLRKSNGDWLLPKGKTEELLTDHELIGLLNQLYEKSGKSLQQHSTLPPHKVVTLLKPDGKGGTSMMVTQETLP